MSAIVLTLLKYAGMVMATCLGAFGLVTNFRDKDTDRVSSGGRKLLAGIIAAGMMAIATQAVEDLRQQADREDAIEQAARGQYPLQKLRLTCWASVEGSEPHLSAFSARLAKDTAFARGEVARGSKDVPGISGWNGGVGQLPTYMGIARDSPFYPDPQKEPFASSVFRNFEVVLRFYRRPIQVSAYPVRGVGTAPGGWKELARPDLEMTFRSRQEPSLNYSFDNGGFVTCDQGMQSDSRSWASSGKIVSLANLRGAQMFIQFTPLPLWEYGVPTPPNRVAPTLQTLIVEIGDLYPFWIDVSKTTLHRTDDGSVFYEFRFPPTIDEILELNRAG